MENMLMKFGNNEVKIIIENGDLLFEIYSTGMALGQVKKNTIGGKTYYQCRKDRVNENLKNADIKPLDRNGLKYITESQLYDLILEMKTDKAKSFKKWVTEEVLPTIRKTGGYVGDDDLFVNTYLPYADESVKKLFKLNLMTIRQLNDKIYYMLPLAEFAEAVANTSDTIDIGQFAKLANDEHINIGRNRLFEWLRKQGYLRENNEPYQKYINCGWFKTIEEVYNTSHEEKINLKTLVTGKGQLALIKRLRKSFTEKLNT